MYKIIKQLMSAVVTALTASDEYERSLAEIIYGRVVECCSPLP